jgi:hypothetical protein
MSDVKLTRAQAAQDLKRLFGEAVAKADYELQLYNPETIEAGARAAEAAVHIFETLSKLEEDGFDRPDDNVSPYAKSQASKETEALADSRRTPIGGGGPNVRSLPGSGAA